MEEDHHDHEEEVVMRWKHVCKFCRKRFQSGRSLGGHMRSHMVDDVSALTDGTLITRKKLPSLPHLTEAAKSASLSVGSKNNINNGGGGGGGSCSGTSGNEDQQEQEEVAMCLMLLSRDIVHVTDESYSGKSTSDCLELTVSENTRKGGDGSCSDGLSQETESETSDSKRKRKLGDDDDAVLNSVNNSSIKFECEACNKKFHSYQALGGHKASHKKIKGCSFNSNEEEETHDGSKLIMMKSMKHEILSNNNNIKSITTTVAATEKKKKKSSSERVHECPICFKVFTTGQALGGHKRSHLLVGTSASVSAEEEEIPDIKNFMVDLNLPAQVDEDSIIISNSNINRNLNDAVFENPWWTGSKHEQQLVVTINL